MESLLIIIFYYIVPLCISNLLVFFLGLIMILCLLVLYFEDPIYSVLALMLIFMLTAFTLILLNVEFLAYVYVIVYVGAVVLLFVFVVFTLGPIYTKSYQSESFFYFYIFITKFLILFSIAVWDFVFFQGYDLYQSPTPLNSGVYSNDIFIFSRLLYTDHLFLLWLVAVVLLLAMLAPIIFHFNRRTK